MRLEVIFSLPVLVVRPRQTKISLIIRSSTYLVETGESPVCLLTIAESSPSPSVCAGERWAGGGVRADPTWYYTILVSTDQTITL